MNAVIQLPLLIVLSIFSDTVTAWSFSNFQKIPFPRLSRPQALKISKFSSRFQSPRPFSSLAMIASEYTVARKESQASTLAGQPEIIDILQAKYRDLGSVDVETVTNCFPFPLDNFQRDAISALVEKRSVIVSAPTGSGKTVCGEAAVYLGLALGKKVLYTTPLKALSNQKYYDFCKQFGSDRVGLLTGDVTQNRDNATVIVLTTEVYRNMLYDKDGGSISDVHSVILDEFHYMNDRDRGTVWEECVIHSPPEVLLVALSATMQNVQEICDWFSFVHGPTSLITSDFRPVPLQFKFVDERGLLDLFDAKLNKKGQPRLNRRLLPPSLLDDGPATRRSIESGRRGSKGAARGGARGGTRGGARAKDEDRRGRRGKGRDSDRDRGDDRKRGGGGVKGRTEGGVPSVEFTVRQLAKRDMLPAIFFIFSRQGCDKAAAEAAAPREPLVSDEERMALRQRLGEFATKHQEVAKVDRLRLAVRGIASHHAGLVPLWKALVEELFQDGLIKAVFATETLAAGINMPARTTVVTALSKRSDEGIVSLTANELRQMCGRAGRRGKDVVGHAVLMRSRWEGAPEGFALATRPADALRSKFTPNYAMVLGLLDQRPLEECRRIVECSFGSFLATRRTPRASGGGGANEDGRAAATDLDAAEALLASVDPEALRGYRKAMERLKSEERVLTYLQQQARKTMQAVFEDTLPFCGAGTLLLLRPLRDGTPANRTDEPAALLDLAPGAPVTEPLYATLTSGNVIRMVPADEVVEVGLDLPVAPLGPLGVRGLLRKIPERRLWLRDSRGGLYVSGDEETQAVARQIPALKPPGPVPDVLAQEDRLRFLRQAIVSHPIHTRPDRSAVLAAARMVAEAGPRARATPPPVSAAPAESAAWRDFLACGRVLRDFGMLQGYNLTDLGRLVGAVSADNPLWVGTLLVSSQALVSLGPHQLAAALSCVSSEAPRPDVYVGYQPSEPVLEFAREAEDMRVRVVSAQLTHGVTFEANLDLTLAGLVEAWAVGVSWKELVAKTSLQEGDVVRVLRRVLDLLRQIPRLPYVPGELGVVTDLRLNARRAVGLMDRFPISDDITYSVGDDEALQDGWDRAELEAARREQGVFAADSLGLGVSDAVDTEPLVIDGALATDVGEGLFTQDEEMSNESPFFDDDAAADKEVEEVEWGRWSGVDNGEDEWGSESARVADGEEEEDLDEDEAEFVEEDDEDEDEDEEENVVLSASGPASPSATSLRGGQPAEARLGGSQDGRRGAVGGKVEDRVPKWVREDEAWLASLGLGRQLDSLPGDIRV